MKRLTYFHSQSPLDIANQSEHEKKTKFIVPKNDSLGVIVSKLCQKILLQTLAASFSGHCKYFGLRAKFIVLNI